MKNFPREWTEESDSFTVRLTSGALVLDAKAGREADFDGIARTILNRTDHFAVFPRRDAFGLYDSVQIISTAPLAAI
jgi:hypothetical protein